MKILIAEDEKEIANGIKTLLEQNGHQVFLTSNGYEALESAKQYQPDVLITDIIMPEMDGIELIIKIRKQSPEIKIIAISGGGRISAEEHLESAHNLGAMVTLKKPFSFNQLLMALETETNKLKNTN
jgi:CheY-like chemotaxis protein